MELTAPSTTGATPFTLSTEVPVGAIDSSNTTYTVVHTPIFLEIDGMTRVAGYGYTYVAPTITVDPLTPPTESIISFYQS